jgi:hypothetical protein
VTQNTQKPVLPPAGAFWRGALAGIVVVIPLLIVTEFVLSRAGIGDPDASISRIFQFAFAFAALPAALTSGGVARLAARAALMHPGDRTAATLKAGATTFAPAGVGLLLLIAVPLGKLPQQSWRWFWLVFAGAIAGAAAGAVIGRVALFAVKEPHDEKTR